MSAAAERAAWAHAADERKGGTGMWGWIRRGASAGCVAAVAGAIGVTAAVAAPPMVADANVDVWTLYSAWASLNDVNDTDCTPTGPARKVDGVTFHATFTCAYTTIDGTSGTVTARALGPQWLRITSRDGGLKPDPPLGKLPKGARSVDFSAAGTALERSAWGRSNDVDTAFCQGVGPYTELPAQVRYFTFSCATLNTFASRGPHVLVTVDAKGTARVLRVIAP